ncbi:MAG: hypothetical protein HXY51_00970 [Nitrospirae bacterium]|nr:hypothetical protein [Nitrospirota bacterium]
MNMSMRAAVLLGALIAGVVAPLHASAVIYPLDYVFSPPTGTVTPLGTVTLTDLGTAVQFDVLNQAGAGTKLDSLYFNFAHGSLNPDQLAFSNVSAVTGTYSTLLAPTTSSTINGLKADGDGYFDGKFEYTTNNFLGHGQTLSFHLSVVGQDLGVEDFHFFSLPGGGTGSYVMASHIQNLPGSGDSLWVGTATPVPLPAAVLLFGSGLMGLFPMLRRYYSAS